MEAATMALAGLRIYTMYLIFLSRDGELCRISISSRRAASGHRQAIEIGLVSVEWLGQVSVRERVLKKGLHEPPI